MASKPSVKKREIRSQNACQIAIHTRAVFIAGQKKNHVADYLSLVMLNERNCGLQDGPKEVHDGLVLFFIAFSVPKGIV